MPAILGVIPTQGFEKVKEAIGAILKTELDNQKTLQELPDSMDVYKGRTNPFQHSERLMFNVDIDNAAYTSDHQVGTDGRVEFYIDIYTSTKQIEGVDGGELSSTKRDKYLGMVRYIFSDHHYNTLGLPGSVVLNVSVKGFENFEPTNKQDAAFVKMSRLSISVRIYEDQSLWDGININTIFANVKLYETEKGYKYETIN